jgi:predicted nucleotide-binding protein
VPPRKAPAKAGAAQQDGTTADPPELRDRNPERKPRAQSDFPKATLEEAARIATAIEEVNAGRPYPPTDTAIALNMSPGGSAWRVLTAASFKYGLTTGNYKSERLEITPLALRIVAPTSSEDKAAALFQAATSPATFKAIFDYLKGKKLPLQEFFANTLVREFSVPKEQATVAVDIFTKNAKYVGLTRTTPTGQWLGNEPVNVPPDMALGEEVGEVDGERLPANTRIAPPASLNNEEVETPNSHDEIKSSGKGRAIFVGHGKNRKPLQQLERILNEYRIPFKVAIGEPNAGRPISEKVAQVMQECGAAVLIFTADEEFRSVAGEEIWRPSENVVYELGAASVMYGRRIIVFKEQNVTFPTNFQDIGYIPFEKDKLDAKGIELFRELIAFSIIQVSVPN